MLTKQQIHKVIKLEDQLDRVRGDGPLAAHLTTSGFAKTLSAKLTADIPPEIVEWGERVIDAELQEVREVLLVLRSNHTVSACWCRREEYGKGGPHDERCQRARALLSQLEIK